MRSQLISALLLAVHSFATGAHAQERTFPSHTVRVIVPYPAGGPNDIVARAISQKLGETWKQPVVVENRPAGAGGIVGTDVVAKAAPDGYTLVLNGITHAILPSLHPKLPFHPLDDFTPISMVGYAPLLFVVNASVPVKSVTELIALAKAQPGKLAYASTGNGTSIHIASEMFKRMAGVDILHVPYRGSAPAMNDLVGGQVQMMIEAMPSALPHVQSGSLRALAVTSSKRSPELPDLPSVDEAGLPGFEAGIWWGFLGPAKIPAPLVDKLNAAINATLQSPEVRSRLAVFGIQPIGTTPKEFEDVVRRDMARFGKVVQEAGIRIGQP